MFCSLGRTRVLPLSLHPPKLDTSELDQELSIKYLRNFKPQQKDIILNALRLDSVGKETAWLTVLAQTPKF